MADYFEIFDDTRAGILGALDRAVTEAHAWEFLRYWEPEWEMVPLPSIEQRLPNRDAYDNDVFGDCFDIIWTIARTDWLAFRETYIEEHPPCRCRQLRGKLADNCWPRYPEGDEQAMCNDIRDYSLVLNDNERIERLQALDRAVTRECDWEFWAESVHEGWEYRVRTYGVEGVTREDIEMIADIAEVGWRQYVDGVMSGRLDTPWQNDVN
jgi:hypothetical protein